MCWSLRDEWIEVNGQLGFVLVRLRAAAPSATQHEHLVQLGLNLALEMCPLVDRQVSSSHAKHLVDTLRPKTCAAFGSLRTLDTVTDGQGSEQVREELSRNSTVPEPSPHSQERFKGYICFTLELVGLSTFNGEITPTGVGACFSSRKLDLNEGNAS